ncbi:hypothetical protein SUGI_0997990 [Cryptomeria japonica]|nr:hypothetical protein SUGI_0997990 [Cryptomeria japonica]
MNSSFRFRANVDVASIFLAWCLEFGIKEDVKWAMREYIREEGKYGLNMRDEAHDCWSNIKEYLWDREVALEDQEEEDGKKKNKGNKSISSTQLPAQSPSRFAWHVFLKEIRLAKFGLNQRAARRYHEESVLLEGRIGSPGGEDRQRLPRPIFHALTSFPTDGLFLDFDLVELISLCDAILLHDRKLGLHLARISQMPVFVRQLCF